MRLSTQSDSRRYVRFQAETANRRGIRPGVFALVNGLAREGRLSAGDESFWRSSNDWFTARLLDPTAIDPQIFRLHPLAVSWFDEHAVDLLARIPGYLEILDRHSVGWQAVVAVDPGPIVYSDADQVLAIAGPRQAAMRQSATGTSAVRPIAVSAKPHSSRSWTPVSPTPS